MVKVIDLSMYRFTTRESAEIAIDIVRVEMDEHINKYGWISFIDIYEIFNKVTMSDFKPSDYNYAMYGYKESNIFVTTIYIDGVPNIGIKCIKSGIIDVNEMAKLYDFRYVDINNSQWRKEHKQELNNLAGAKENKQTKTTTIN